MIRNTGCCGIKEIDGLRTKPIDNLGQVIDYRTSVEFCSVLFSDVVDFDRGRNLAKYIKENKLGDLVKMEKVLNPNSNNIIEAWLWTINTDAIFQHYNQMTGANYKPYIATPNVW